MSRLFLLLALLAAPLPVHSAEPFHFPEAKHGTGELRYINKVPVLTVSGSPEQIGEAVGVLAVKPAPRVLDYPRGLINFFNAGFFWNVIVSQGQEMSKHFPADYSKEMDALIKASDAPRDKVVAGNTLFDIKKIILCSALMIEPTKSATGGPLLGRNLDYPSLDYIQEYGLVTVYRPTGKHAFVSVGFPGLVGTLSGMNDAGLSVAVLEVMSSRNGEGRFDIKGIPYAMCFRTILEECVTIDEARKKLESLPRTTILNMVVADRTSVGTFEVTPKTVIFRPAEKGVCSCANHFCTEVRPDKKINVCMTYDRFDILERARQTAGKLTVADVQRKLDAVNLGDLTLQTMVFEPATLKLHIAMGKAPSSRLPMRTLELAPLMKGEK
jgi:predicted choloylglycine hydrolase